MKDPKATLERIRHQLESGARDAIAPELLGARPEDVAQLMGDLSDAEVEAVFQQLASQAPDLAAEVLALLDRHDVHRLLGDVPDPHVADLMEKLPPDDATWIAELLPDRRVEAVVAAMEAPESAEVRGRLDYPESSAGRIMSDEFLALAPEATAGEAVRRLQEAGEEVTIYYVYLVDAEGRLAGVVSLRRLLRVKGDRALADLTPDGLVSVGVLDDQEDVAQVVAQQDLVCVPVVDGEGRLVGVVTHDDVIDVLREEATEDMLHMAGTTSDDVISQSVWRSARIRAPWLLFCLLGQLVCFKVLDLSEQKLGAMFLVVIGFVPAIIAMGGNVGTQAATIVVRGLATGRVRRHDAVPVFWRELRTAVVMGLVYGVFLALLARFLLGFSPDVCFVAGIGLSFSMVLAAALGSLVPIVFHVVGVDPAVATGPLVTTAMDVFGISAFFLLAAWFLV